MYGEIRQRIETITGNSLYLNSIILMLATAVMSAFGFFFWVISARLVSTENIGIATTLISSMSIISIFSLIGFDSTIVRFLSSSEKKNNKLNTALILVGTISLILSSLFILFIKTISPQLGFISDSYITSVGFIFFCVMTALNILTDSVFLSYRQTKYTLYINTVFSFIKVFLPLAFMSFGAIGIFLSAALGQTVGFILSIIIMMVKFDYKPEFVIDTEIIKSVWKFSITNYISGAFNLIPATVLPIIITNRIGLEESAYFYIVMMIINLLYVVPQATTKSLFAEGSFSEKSFSENVRKSIKMISILLLPAVLVLGLFGDKILLIFGDNYSRGHLFMAIMSLSAILISVNSIFNSFFRIKHNLGALVTISAFYSISIIGFAYLFLNKGLLGIGLAWIIGTAISTIVSFAFYRFYYVVNTHKFLSYLPYWRGFDDRLGELNIIIWAKFNFLKVFVLNGFKSKKIIFYPQKPNQIHSAYQVLNFLGYTITNDPTAKAEKVFVFEDTTIRNSDPVLDELNKKYKVVNYRCGDISKEKVDEVFSKVFGYSTFVNPKEVSGKFVEKSSTNATHDGKIIDCPTQKKDGYVYQKFINTKQGDLVMDMRLLIFGSKVAFVVKRFKHISNPFDGGVGAEPCEVRDVLSQDEIEKVNKFCEEFGLEYGEIDSLRDIDDGKLYLVDANNTPSGPRPGRAMPRSEQRALLRRVINSFASAFLTQ